MNFEKIVFVLVKETPKNMIGFYNREIVGDPYLDKRAAEIEAEKLELVFKKINTGCRVYVLPKNVENYNDDYII